MFFLQFATKVFSQWLNNIWIKGQQGGVSEECSWSGGPRVCKAAKSSVPHCASFHFWALSSHGIENAHNPVKIMLAGL